MTRHVPRRERWERHGPNEHRSIDGHVVRYEQGAWWADVVYYLRASDAEGASAWERHTDRLGPFKRPRNAMVEAERHLTLLQNRHGERLRLGEPGA